MEHKMRRSDRLMDEEKTKELLIRGEYGVLSMTDADGAPYAVPLSYVYMNDSIYFHCALSGRKLDCLSREPRVCFNVVDGVKAIYANDFTTLYNSAMVFGKAYIVTDEEEKGVALYALSEKYLPEHIKKAPKDITQFMKRTGVYKIIIESMSGKANTPK